MTDDPDVESIQRSDQKEAVLFLPQLRGSLFISVYQQSTGFMPGGCGWDEALTGWSVGSSNNCERVEQSQQQSRLAGRTRGVSFVGKVVPDGRVGGRFLDLEPYKPCSIVSTE